ncbi:pyrroloquinoline quinone biosynthesis protein PqqF [Pseudomonas sp. 5P_5.1_Bac1]|uniref:pyrroloquinoline quinone biosynthesis protein PqqF n=1 Tax=Pseudomonas sp. 5P_5.1_Bac1 TaxID=2971616 RepID=UPI0021CA3DE9|nr:pyrroloquinoline quinone biosynthesis protein PqqF [Pseudomonas sp. 5P_5.1_Bac1]MCU1725367.1 pyrroloquinoline quinone biosynthesis protein PqqF [Pseudomonas sp. 5P_5.1_Bac1]
MSSTLQHLILSNGLRVNLRHAPHLKRCAAAVRVHAGSHDAPADYPGLAHFLEHLFFLGTVRFPVEDGLMRFVQREGGQLNASTRERTTEFFFEVPPAAFPGALERLCEMLANPLLTPERQHAEREVIHAEWVAWSGNTEAQRQYALLRSVSAKHPLSGFHAGNRDSLPTDEPAFQQALSAFHQRFYQAGQMTLSLSGPQSLDELERAARKFGKLFATGTRIEQTAPPALLDGPLRVPPIDGQLDLLFAHEHLPDGADEAIDYLTTWITDTRPGGLPAELCQRGWLEDFSFTALYQFGDQALLHARLKLSPNADAVEAEALLHDWLAFFREADHSALLLEYQRLQACREAGASALELARCERPFAALDQQGQAALRVLLAGTGVSRHPWQLPEPEPLLAATVAEIGDSPIPAGLTVSLALPAVRQYAALYLRLQFEDHAEHLRDVLKPLIERASRAAVELKWTRTANTWQLRCAGAPAPALAVIEQALSQLGQASATEPGAEPPLIPIRALMRELPHRLLTPAAPGWTALSTGFDEAAQNVLNRLLAGIPGNPITLPSPTPPVRQWHHCAEASGEPALLLFCPTTDETSGRLLGQLIQGPFYQRLRSELQLGYAVFSAFRQIQGHNGLMFGVQSPSASHEEILSHIRAFLARPAPDLGSAREALAVQLAEPAMPNADVAEWAWQTHLAGNDGLTLDRLSAAILTRKQVDIERAWEQLGSEKNWLLLANGPPPQSGWL